MSLFSKILARRTLRFALMARFCALMAAVLVCLEVYVHQKSQSVFMEFAKSENHLKTLRRANTIKKELSVIELAVKTSSHMIAKSEDLSSHNKDLTPHLSAFLNNHPLVSSLVIAVESKKTLLISKVNAKTKYVTKPEDEFPEGTKYMFCLMQAASGESTNVEARQVKAELYYCDKSGIILDREFVDNYHRTLSLSAYDWYKKTLHKKSTVWSQPYFFQNDRLSVSLSCPLGGMEGKDTGCIAAIIATEDFETLLQDPVLFSRNQTTHVLSGLNGEIYSCTGLANPRCEENGKPKELLLQNAGMQNLIDVFAQGREGLRQSGGEEMMFFKEGQNGLDSVCFTKLSLPFGDTYFFIISSMVFWVRHLETIRVSTVISMCMLLLVALYFLNRLARRISRPLHDLVIQARHITALDMDIQKGEGKRSSIYEIGQLQETVDMMHTTLNSFAKFVPRSLLKKLLVKNIEIKPGGKARKLTVFFSDIEGFTTISHHHSADRMSVYLCEYFEEATKIILEHNGTLDKYIGDGILAFWGAPQADKDAVLHACEAALLLQKRLEDLNRKWTHLKRPVFKTRIGIHSGQVNVGYHGSSERLEYTILGDTVNIASRLEGLNKLFHTKLLVSVGIWEELGSRAVGRPLGLMPVRGMEEPLEVYELAAMNHRNPDLFADEAQERFYAGFTNALHQYMKRDFAASLVEFEKLTPDHGEDHALSYYIAMCRKYLEEPPGKEWDPVVRII